jgi:FtsP/CotA-like multicopper oxidase with cupredoxin domain
MPALDSSEWTWGGIARMALPPRANDARHASACTARRDSLTWRRLEIVALDGMPHWHTVNEARVIHPFHIHQVHFFAYAKNGVLLANPAGLDPVNVPYGGSADVIMDFTDPVIRGMSVFHCHLLNDEDKGMLAKILVE